VNVPLRNMRSRFGRLVLLRVSAVVAAFLVSGATAHASPAAGSKEYQVKAAFLYSFTKFVEWPKETFASAADPIVIGLLGADPFGGELEIVVRGRTVNGRPVEIVQLQNLAEAKRVAVLFVPAGGEVLFEASHLTLDRSVLTVGETERFAALGGMIVFKNVDDKVRFTINTGESERAGIKISAHLQKLALAVRRQP
jgi:hypothetical protein